MGGSAGGTRSIEIVEPRWGTRWTWGRCTQGTSFAELRTNRWAMVCNRVAVREKVSARWGFCDWVMMVSRGLHARLCRRLFVAAARFNRPYGTRNLVATLQFPAINRIMQTLANA